MKIVIDGRMYGTEYTGIGRYVMNLVSHLQSLDKKNEYQILLRDKYYKSLRLTSNWKKIKADYPHYSVQEQIHLPLLLSKLDFDLVHFPHFNIPIVFNGNFLVTIHDNIMHKKIGEKATTRNKYFHAIKRIGYKKTFDHAVKKSQSIIVPSKYSKKELLRKFDVNKEKIEVVYEAVDSNIKSVKSKQNEYAKKFANLKSKKYFIYTGNAYPHKNLKRLLEAFKYLNEDLKKPVYLVLVTPENKFKKDLQEIISKLSISEFVLFYSNVKDDELAYLYSNSVAFIYPSFEEGFGLPGLEAMAQETIAIVSDIPVFNEVYSKAAIYFNPFDFSSIQKEMFNVLNMDRKSRAVILEKSKKLLERYSMEKMAKETLKIYENSISLRQGK